MHNIIYSVKTSLQLDISYKHMGRVSESREDTSLLVFDNDSDDIFLKLNKFIKKLISSCFDIIYNKPKAQTLKKYQISFIVSL